MYAVIKTGGKQYRVAQGDRFRVEKLAGNVGDTVTLGEVLLAQLLPRSQGAGDDRLPQRAIGLVLEQDAPGGVEGHN